MAPTPMLTRSLDGDTRIVELSLGLLSCVWIPKQPGTVCRLIWRKPELIECALLVRGHIYETASGRRLERLRFTVRKGSLVSQS